MGVLLNITSLNVINRFFEINMDVVPTVGGESPATSGVIIWGDSDDITNITAAQVFVDADPGLGLPAGSKTAKFSANALPVTGSNISVILSGTFNDGSFATDSISIPINAPQGIEISGITVSNITTSEATVGWQMTDYNFATYYVNYGSNLVSPSGFDQLFEKSVSLTDLSAGTTYAFTPVMKITTNFDYLFSGTQGTFTTIGLTASSVVIGSLPLQDSGVLGSQAFGIGTNLNSPNYTSADSFIDNILK